MDRSNQDKATEEGLVIFVGTCWPEKRDKDDGFSMGIRTPLHSSRRLLLHTIGFLFDLGLIVAILCPKIFNQESSASRMGWREEG